MIDRTLGHYRITAAIGEGGMGEVYRATDTKLGREVALKILPAAMAANPEMLDRFRREARAVAALNHPNVITLFSVENAEGLHFLTMELIEGQSLDLAIPDGGFDIRRVLEIATALSGGLAAAHDKGVIHRDLKPANVMVGRDGTVKILDFGLARVQTQEPAADATQASTVLQTRPGVVMGTMPYMSPEQVQGQELDHRTDIFSLGVLLYEISTGQRPFRGHSSADLFASILRDEPPAISEIRGELPADLVRVIRRCLEKDPRRRIQTAVDVGNELRDHLTSGPAAPEIESPAVESPVAVVAIAVLPFADMSPARDQEYLCEGMADEISHALVPIEGLNVASRTSTFRAHHESSDLAAIARALSVTHALEGSVRTAGTRLRITAQLTEIASGYHLWSERFDREAADIFAVQDEIADGVFEAVKARLAPGATNVHAARKPLNLDAYRSYLKGRHLRRKEHQVEAMEAFEEAVRLDPAHGPSWNGLAECTVLTAHFSIIPAREACAAAREAVRTADALQGESADGLHAEAFAAMIERQWEQMEVKWKRALALEPTHVQALASFGVSLCIRERLDEGFALLDRAREADPLASFPYMLTGLSLLDAGRPAEAQRALEDALSFEKEDAAALYTSGGALMALGRFDEAIAALRRAVEVTQRGPHMLGTLGWALATAGQEGEARDILAELQAHPEDAPTVVSEGWLLGALGDPDAAFELLARAEEECQAFLYYTGFPAYDPLRGDPRFTALRERLGLEPARPL